MSLGATNSAGTLIDLSRYQITWYQNGRFFESGVGKITFPLAIGTSQDSVRVIVYGDSGGVLGEVSTNIPTMKPYAVFVPEVAPDDPGFIILHLLPFSWSIERLTDLTISWSVPTGTPGDSGDAIRLPAAPSMGSIGSVLIQNPARALEYAKRIIRLPYATFEQ